jgi:signal transduction histidine kinase
MTAAHGSLPVLVWVAAATALALAALAGFLALWLSLRKSFRTAAQDRREHAPRANPEHPAALLATIQAVIEKLREQEKQVARLYQLERERARSTARLGDAVIRNMPTGLLLINASGLITLSNRAAERALGTGGLAYRSYREVFGADAPLARLVDACLEKRATFLREEIIHRTPAGDERRLGTTISPVEGQDPERAKATGALCLLSDLTELAALESQMRLRESLAALGEMSAGIAHEFKNSLGIISGYAQMLARELPPGEPLEAAGRIAGETRRLSQVVRELLQFARPIEAVEQPVALGALVEQVIAGEREEARGVRFRVEGEFVELTGDESLLRQALANLIRNASEAARERPAGGEVVVRGWLEEKASRPGASLSVADNGPGISPEALPKLFLPFYTTKAGGTGLGLAVVLKIVLQHGGRIEARNRAASGAEFTLWLPIGGKARTERLVTSASQV